MKSTILIMVLIFSAGYDAPVNAGNDTAKSVEITHIVQLAGPLENSIMLEWITLSENKNEGFVIERRCKDSENFEYAGYVDGNGTTDVKSKYQFVETMSSLKVQYRIKQVSYNGIIEYFYPVQQ